MKKGQKLANLDDLLREPQMPPLAIQAGIKKRTALPPHLRGENVNELQISAAIHYGRNPEIYHILVYRINPPTKQAFENCLAGWAQYFQEEKRRQERFEAYLELKGIEQRINDLFPDGLLSAIGEVYRTYLIKQGLPC